MICKHGNYENGYIFTSTSTDEEFQEILNKYDKVRCVICNSNTARNFRVGLWGTNIITINNKINDGCFFINQMRKVYLIDYRAVNNGCPRKEK